MPRFQPKNSTEEDTQEPEALLNVERKPSVSESRESIVSKFEIKEIPSQFKAYPKNTSIVVDTYSYREIKLLSDSRIPIDKQYEIMLRGFDVSGMNSLNITFFDFIYIGILRKLSSMGSLTYRLPYFCDKCNDMGIHRFKLEDVGFKTMDAPELPIRVNSFSLGELVLSPLTVGAYIDLFKNNQLYEKDREDNVIIRSDGTSVINSVAIFSKQCLNSPFDEAYKKFYGAKDYRDQELLDKIDSLFDHGIETLKFKCENQLEKAEPGTHPSMLKKCDNNIVRDLVGGESLILPFREHGETYESRISFGSAGHS